MKKVILLIFTLFFVFYSIDAQNDTLWSTSSICHGDSYNWVIPASETSVSIIYHDGIYDTIVGSHIKLEPDTTTTYILLSTDGHIPDSLWVLACKISVLNGPSFTINDIHHVTCPLPYLGPGSPDNARVGPWADGDFSFLLTSDRSEFQYFELGHTINNLYYIDWRGGNGNINGSMSFLQPNTYTFTAYATNGCTTSQKIVIQQPPAWEEDTINTIWESFITCNHNATLKFECSGGTPPYTWAWQYGEPDYWIDELDPIWFENGTMQFPDSSSITVDTPGRYWLRVSDSRGCIWMHVACVFTVYQILPDTVNLHYYLPQSEPELIKCPEEMEVCENSPYFNALSRGHGSYLWSTGDTNQNFIGPNRTGWLSVQFTDQNGCKTNDSVYIELIDPNINIFVDSIMYNDSTYIVEFFPTGGNIYIDGEEIPTYGNLTTIDTRQYTLGNHTLSYAGYWGQFDCFFEDSISFTIQERNDISEFQKDITIWPTPVSNVLNIQHFNISEGYIQIFDIVGRKLKTIMVDSEQTSINVSDLSSGTYFIRFISRNNTFTKKFVKK